MVRVVFALLLATATGAAGYAVGAGHLQAAGRTLPTDAPAPAVAQPPRVENAAAPSPAAAAPDTAPLPETGAARMLEILGPFEPAPATNTTRPFPGAKAGDKLSRPAGLHAAIFAKDKPDDAEIARIAAWLFGVRGGGLSWKGCGLGSGAPDQTCPVRVVDAAVWSEGRSDHLMILVATDAPGAEPAHVESGYLGAATVRWDGKGWVLDAGTASAIACGSWGRACDGRIRQVRGHRPIAVYSSGYTAQGVTEMQAGVLVPGEGVVRHALMVPSVTADGNRECATWPAELECSSWFSDVEPERAPGDAPYPNLRQSFRFGEEDGLRSRIVLERVYAYKDGAYVLAEERSY